MTDDIRKAQITALREWLDTVWAAADRLRRDIFHHCLNARNLRRWYPALSSDRIEQELLDAELDYGS